MLKIFYKIFLPLIVLFLFNACDNPGETYEDYYYNPDADNSKEVKFSRESGYYSSSFKLTLHAVKENSEVYYTTDGSVPSPGKSGTINYTEPISIVNRNSPMQDNVLSATNNHIQMFMYPNDPRGYVPKANNLTKEEVPKANVIRAIAVDSDGNRTSVVTRTYFVGNKKQLFNNTDVRIISLVSDPDGLVSNERGILVRGNPDARWGYDQNDNLYNFLRRGEAWERACSFELFDGNKKLLLSTNSGIRVRGGYSRGIGQKSFNIYFRSEHGGINNFVRSAYNFELIPGAVKANGSPVDTTKGFMLRSGGNDSDYTKFYDVFLHDILKDRKFRTQAAVPVIVYLNGEYWGPYNMQERYSDNHTEYKYGVNRNNVISIDNGELDDGNPGEENLFWTAVYDMINGGDYALFCQRFDMDNFADYWAAQIYIYNEDWPHSNYIVWRTRTTEAGNPYGDTKWRYSLHDSEYSMGIYSGGSITGQTNYGDAFKKIISGEYSNNFHNRLFVKLLENDDFCKKLADTLIELYNVNFHPDNFNPKLTYYANLYRPIMNPYGIPGYSSRWLDWNPNFDNYVNNAKKYLTNIRSALPGYLQTYLKVPPGALKNVTLSASLPGASITVNGSFTPDITGSWTGLLNTQNGITITASAPPSGYEFDGWTVTGGDRKISQSENNLYSKTITVTVTDNMNLKANYKLIGY